jgi:hypothetical protein
MKKNNNMKIILAITACTKASGLRAAAKHTHEAQSAAARSAARAKHTISNSNTHTTTEALAKKGQRRHSWPSRAP